MVIGGRERGDRPCVNPPVEKEADAQLRVRRPYRGILGEYPGLRHIRRRHEGYQKGGFPLEAINNSQLFVRWQAGVAFAARAEVVGTAPSQLYGCSRTVRVHNPHGDTVHFNAGCRWAGDNDRPGHWSRNDHGSGPRRSQANESVVTGTNHDFPMRSHHDRTPCRCSYPNAYTDVRRDRDSNTGIPVGLSRTGSA